MTGDAFRMSKKSSAVQMSYSLLNNRSMLHSPYGQFISSLWRGKDHRALILSHSRKYHSDMKELLLGGAEFQLPNGDKESFNVIPILCADLIFVMAILGKCASNGTYGCYYCDKPITAWNKEAKKSYNKQTVAKMTEYGREGEQLLGNDPDHKTAMFSNFQQSHLGQFGIPLFDGLMVLRYY